MIFDFNKQLRAQNTIDVDNVGTFALRGITDAGGEYYLVAKNVMGCVHFLEWGPIIPETDILLDGYTCKYSKMEYKEAKIAKLISFWLNDRSKEIVNAELILPDEALSEVIDVRKQMWNIEDTEDGN